MFEVIQPYAVYLQYAAPPLVGAFIGYLTNKIAIRMLFRPLKPWHLFGLRVPMTPGVIPAKRKLLARNIGRMVGGHLLTGKEIGKALRKESLQHHLGLLIEERVGGVLEKDLAPLPRLVPRRYVKYFWKAVNALVFQVKRRIHRYLASEECERRLELLVEEAFSRFLAQDLDSCMNRERRQIFYDQLEKALSSFLASREVQQWLEDFLYVQINEVLKKEKSIDDLLPEHLRATLLQAIAAKVPELVEKLAVLLQDPEVQKKLVAAILSGLERFSQSLGPMGGMVKNFLKPETIDKAVRDYLYNHEEEIAAMLGDRQLQEKIAERLLERLRHYLSMPIAALLPGEMSTSDTRKICRTGSEKIAALLREERVASTISALLQDTFEAHIATSGGEVGRLAKSSLGGGNIISLRKWTVAQSIALIRSPRSRQLVDAGVENVFLMLLRRRVGRLSRFLPGGVRTGLFSSLRRIATAVLRAEVPGLVASLDIEGIVTEKVDSLDLLHLEGLLLSIMQEQFKYINLFGALLGFGIGLVNVLVMYFF